MAHRAILPALLLLFLHPAAARPADPASVPVGEVPGALVMVGGGRVPEAAVKRFLELAGGPKARLVVIPTASITADGSDGDSSLDPWKKLPTAALVSLHTRDRQRADDPAFVKPLTEATGVWIEGGDQSRLTATYLGTAVERELKKVLARGGVVGGTSAGTAVMTEAMIEGGNPRAQVARGFGLLSGVVVDQHLLQRNRLNRLLGALAGRPGLFGLGIDEGTAVIVKGRTLTVVGDSYALTVLAPSPRRPLSVQVLHNGESADLIALSRAAVARAAPPFPPDRPPPPVVENGTLFIVGGGRMPPEAWQRFIAAAGGPEALIVVVPTAGEDPVPAEPGEVLTLKRFGAKNVKVLHTRNRADADRPEFYGVLREAKAVWFGGGRQWRFVDSYGGTGTERAFHDVLRRGGVIGGSSAGASIQGDYLARGNPRGNLDIMAEGYERGFAFLPGSAIDQHFFARKRQRDMAELIATFPQLLGLGIDEGTVVIVHGPEFEVIGASKVAVFDRRNKLPDVREFEELSAGMRYDLAHGRKLSAPPAK
jgi:cyanophycinase